MANFERTNSDILCGNSSMVLFKMVVVTHQCRTNRFWLVSMSIHEQHTTNGWMDVQNYYTCIICIHAKWMNVFYAHMCDVMNTTHTHKKNRTTKQASLQHLRYNLHLNWMLNYLYGVRSFSQWHNQRAVDVQILQKFQRFVCKYQKNDEHSNTIWIQFQ